MDVLGFRRGQLEDFNEDVLDVLVNGRPLADVVGEVELPFASAEDHPNIAGSYRGLVVWRLEGRLRDHFLGSPDGHLHCGPHDKTVLLGCNCGEPGCWPLMARIQADEQRVSWDRFEQPHRRGRWSHGDLSFCFARDQYEAALADAL